MIIGHGYVDRTMQEAEARAPLALEALGALASSEDTPRFRRLRRRTAA